MHAVHSPQYATSPSSFLLERLKLIYKSDETAHRTHSQLMQIVERRLAERSADLRQLDRARQAQPDWFTGNHFMAYTGYVKQFAGTLQGMHKRLDHLENLGVNYLHLLPFLRMRPDQNDGGFAVEDFLNVEPSLGNNTDLQTLAAELRQRGISLCSDFVLNHVADTHQWARAARAGHQDAIARFHFKSDSERTELEQHLPQIFPQTAPGNFVWIPELGQFVWSTFYTYQWDLNYANPAVLVDMIDQLLGLANLGVEIFRLDSAAFLWKKPGTNCMNQAECHWILQCFRAVVDMAAPGVLLKAEAIVPTQELPPYFGQGDAQGKECQLAYQSSLMAASWFSLANQDTRLMQHLMRTLPAMSTTSTWISYIRCHDDIGWNVLKADLPGEQMKDLVYASRFFSGELEGSYARGLTFQASSPDAVHGTNGMSSELLGWTSDETDAENRYQLMTALMFSTAGIPMLYMGDELAQGNQSMEHAHQWTDSRDLHRPNFDQKLLDRSKETGTREYRAMEWIKRLRRLQRQHFNAPNSSALKVIDTHSNALLAFEHGQVQCVFNFSAKAVDYRPAGELPLRDLLREKEWTEGVVPPYTALYLSPTQG